MKTATHRGCKIAYDVQGSGPAVVLQHGLLSNRTTWLASGYVDALADSFTVVCVDSLGHGDSDKPADAAHYHREARAGDIVAVLDEERIERGHYIGYSMGGWIGSGMAVHHPDRLLSLTIGGWDPVGGVARDAPRPAGIDAFLKLAKAAAPHLTSWVTDDVKPGLAACWEALSEVDGTEAALQSLTVPILLWAGTADACFEPAQRLAQNMPNISFHAVPGDHVAARMQYVEESVSGLRAFLEQRLLA